MRLPLPPLPSSASAGRRAARQALTELGRDDLVDDALMIVTELLANAVMHARTPMTLTVEEAGDAVRIAVLDGSDVMPHWAPSSVTAICGRGLPLVVRLSRAWGVEALPDGGKRVWAEVATASTVQDVGEEIDLLALWSDEPWPVERAAQHGRQVDVEVAVQAMLDSRAHTEDLVRDLQLMLLSAGPDGAAGAGTPGTVAAVALARRLDAANEDFHDARRQMFDQTVAAARRREARVVLRLRLQPDDRGRARRWLDTLDEADVLTRQGVLLLAPFPQGMATFRREYITAIIEQLDAA